MDAAGHRDVQGSCREQQSRKQRRTPVHHTFSEDIHRGDFQQRRDQRPQVGGKQVFAEQRDERRRRQVETVPQCTVVIRRGPFTAGEVDRAAEIDQIV